MCPVFRKAVSPVAGREQADCSIEVLSRNLTDAISHSKSFRQEVFCKLTFETHCGMRDTVFVGAHSSCGSNIAIQRHHVYDPSRRPWWLVALGTGQSQSSQRFQFLPSSTWKCRTIVRCSRLPREDKKRRGKGLMPLIPKQDTQPPLSPSTMRVYAISDLHTDYEANMEWVKCLSSTTYLPHTLIVAGDVANSLDTFTTAMRILKEKFQHVFFVAGNHDLWCKSTEGDDVNSVLKLGMLDDTCKSLGVYTTPKKLNGVWIYPILSWYHQSFDKEKDILGYNIRPPHKAASDYRLCKWPLPLDDMNDGCLARYFDELNREEFQREVAKDQEDCQIITFSHFLPRYELCPEKRMLFYPNLPKITGSDWLEARLRTIHGRHGSPTACHVFGHTHFCWDATLDGIRYIQSPLAYPKERERRINGGVDWLPLCLYDSDKGGLVEGPLDCHWSNYYRLNQRDPDNTELAPWVASRYQPVVAS